MDPQGMSSDKIKSLWKSLDKRLRSGPVPTRGELLQMLRELGFSRVTIEVQYAQDDSEDESSCLVDLHSGQWLSCCLRKNSRLGCLLRAPLQEYQRQMQHPLAGSRFVLVWDAAGGVLYLEDTYPCTEQSEVEFTCEI